MLDLHDVALFRWMHKGSVEIQKPSVVFYMSLMFGACRLDSLLDNRLAELPPGHLLRGRADHRLGMVRSISCAGRYTGHDGAVGDGDADRCRHAGVE